MPASNELQLNTHKDGTSRKRKTRDATPPVASTSRDTSERAPTKRRRTRKKEDKTHGGGDLKWPEYFEEVSMSYCT